MKNKFSKIRQGIACVLMLATSLQPVLAAPFQYRIPLQYLDPAGSDPVTPVGNPGTGVGDVDTGNDPEAAKSPVLSVSPEALEFESNPAVEPVTRTSLIANTGPVATAVGGLVSNENFAVSNDCPATLPVGATCRVSVTPKSSAPGIVRYQLGVVAPGAKEQRYISLSTYERRADTPYPRLQVADEVTFLGELNPGETATGSAIITNKGNAPAYLSGVSSAKHFAVTHNCPDTLVPGASCAVSVTFQAWDAKVHQHSMTLLTGSDAGTTPVTFYAAVKGNPALLPALSFDNSSLSFDSQDAGTVSATKKLVLSNQGTSPAQLGTIKGSPDFAVTSTCPDLLAVNATCDVFVTFNALAAGSAPAYPLVIEAQDSVRAISYLSGKVTGEASAGAPAANLVFEPSSLAFGDLGTGQTTSSTVKVSNAGDATALLKSVTLDYGSDAYQLTHTCSDALEPGMSCDLTVKFKPTAATVYPGRIQATTSTGSSALLYLSGTGLRAELAAGPTNIDFGATLKLAPTSPRTVNFSNSGNVPLTGLAVTNNDSRLKVDYGNCTQVIEPKRGCSLTVQYAPAALGAYSGTFQISSDNGGAATIAWSGVAVNLAAAPSSLSYPSTRVGVPAAADQSFQVTNQGPTSVPIDSIGVLSGQYSFGQSNNCGTALAAGATCTVSVRFTPSTEGPQRGLIGIVVRGSVAASVEVEGTGTRPALTLSPASLQFADTNVGQASPVQSIIVSNSNDDVATLNGMGISTGEAEFGQSNNCGESLQPGQSCTVSIQMTPTSTAGSRGTWSVLSSYGSQSVSLSGKGTEPAGGVDGETPVTPSGGSATPISEYDGYTQYVINFLDTEVSRSSAVRNVKFTNRGDGPLTIFGVSLAKGETDYAQSNNCGQQLAPGQFCTISLLFTPAALGDRTGGIALTSDGGNFFFNLKGKGIGAEGSWRADSSADYGDVAVKTAALRGFTLTNMGTIAATAIGAVLSGDNVRITDNTCGTPGAPVPLGVGASCRVTVEYAPTTSGPMTATLQAKGTLANGPVNIALKGNAPPPALAFDASPTGDFGTVTVGTNTPRTYYVRNTGKIRDTVAAMDIVGAGFTVTGGTCKAGVILDPTGICTVTVTVTPTTVGPQAGSLRVTSAQGAAATLTLTGKAIQSEYVISASSTATAAPNGNYGTQTAGNSAAAQTRTYFLRDNEKIATISTRKISIVGDASFKILRVLKVDDRGSYATTCASTAVETTESCAMPAPGYSVGVEVQFMPATVGAKNAVLRFEHNGAGGVAELNLMGEGQFNPTAVWTTSATAVVVPNDAYRTYPTQTPGASVEKTFYLRNTGTNGGMGVGLALAGDTEHFKVTQFVKSYQGAQGYYSACNNSTGVIAAGGLTASPCSADDVADKGFSYAGVYVVIRYQPTKIGNHSITVTSTTNNGTSISAPMTLMGASQFNPTAAWSSAGGSLVAPSTAYRSFGTLTAPSASVTKDIFVRNVGTFGPISVGFTLSGDTSQFQIVQVEKSYQGAEGYYTTCTNSTGRIASGGASATPCLSDDVANNGFAYAGTHLVVRYTPTSVGTHSVTITPSTNNGTILPEPITFTGKGEFNPTAAWSASGGSLVAPTDAYRSYGTLSKGTVLDKDIFIRNVGTNGNLAVGVTLTGDTDQFRLVAVEKSYDGGAGYYGSCNNATGKIAADGTSSTPCVNDDVATNSMYKAIHVAVRYAPTKVGTHSVTLTPATSNGTVLPQPITLTGTSQFNATATWSSSGSSEVAPTPAYLAFGSRAAGTNTDKELFIRNTGTRGALSVGFTLAGDTSQFKIVRLSKAYQGQAGYYSTCTNSTGVIAAGGGSTTPCLTEDIATNSFYAGAYLVIRYAPTKAGSHSVTITPTTNNDTILPGGLTVTGSTP